MRLAAVGLWSLLGRASGQSQSKTISDADSAGYYCCEVEESWGRRKGRVERQRIKSLKLSHSKTKKWREAMQLFWEPEWTCVYEQRTGPASVHGFWLCDPHRFETEDCLVYSMDTDVDFQFETAVVEKYPNCEVHVFNQTSLTSPTREIHTHVWDIAKSAPPPSTMLDGIARMWHGDEGFASLIAGLGHSNREVNVLKIDDLSVEWFNFLFPYFASATEFKRLPLIRQFVLAACMDAKRVVKLVEAAAERGYVVFHKDALYATKGNCMEFGLLYLPGVFPALR